MSVIKEYRKKPVVIEALRFEAGEVEAVAAWCGGDIYHDFAVTIHTLEGMMLAKPGDYVIKGVKGEFYPCKPDIFEATYEAVERTA